MQLKVFVPDNRSVYLNKAFVPILLPFYKNKFSLEERIEKFGEWITKIELVDSIQECHIVVPAHYVNFYYSNNLKKKLWDMNMHANKAHKLTVCFTNGDWGVTPGLHNFHLYRHSGYLSKNAGNQFSCPHFFSLDPLESFYNGNLPIHPVKPQKPIIGFCGRASKHMFSTLEDIAKNCARQGLKLFNKRHEDFESYYGSSYKRFQMLKTLEQSALVETNFIKHEKYLGGSVTKDDKKELSRIFYQNLKESHYIFCFRGWGNFSLRLYETLSAGRIPIIISSDNNLPFPQKINWNIFPIVDMKDAGYIAEKVSGFNSALDDDKFVALQLMARKIWEEFITYKGFMLKITDQYLLDAVRH